MPSVLAMALLVPLAQSYTTARSQRLYIDRLGDTSRFAALAALADQAVRPGGCAQDLLLLGRRAVTAAGALDSAAGVRPSGCATANSKPGPPVHEGPPELRGLAAPFNAVADSVQSGSGLATGVRRRRLAPAT